MKRTIITLGLVGLMSSCGIQFGNYDRWKEVHRNNTCGVKEITDELMYYVQEDVFNGNLNKEISEFYIIELNKIKEYLVVNCENCDEID